MSCGSTRASSDSSGSTSGRKGHLSGLEPMSEAQTPAKRLKFRLALYSLFLVCGLSVFAISYVSPELSIGSGALIALFFLAAWASNRSSRFRVYWKAPFAFFVFSFVWFTRHTILDSALVQPLYKTLNGNVIAQLIDSAVVIIPILLLTLASGDKLSSIFLQRGNVRLGLIVGLIVFIVFLLVSGVVAVQLAGMSPGGFLLLAPYLLVSALANGFKEELWFRGLFLNKYELFIGNRALEFPASSDFRSKLDRGRVCAGSRWHRTCVVRSWFGIGLPDAEDRKHPWSFPVRGGLRDPHLSDRYFFA